jgi:hypothetical protein
MSTKSLFYVLGTIALVAAAALTEQQAVARQIHVQPQLNKSLSVAIPAGNYEDRFDKMNKLTVTGPIISGSVYRRGEWYCFDSPQPICRK